MVTQSRNSPSLLSLPPSCTSLTAHINNLYNTTFWSLVVLSTPPLTERQAHETLKGTVSAQKNEILFSRFGINYERLPAMFRKGTTIVWTEVEQEEEEVVAGAAGPEGDDDGATSGDEEAGPSNGRAHAQTQAQPPTPPPSNPKKSKRRKAPPRELRTLHVDIIGRAFWDEPEPNASRAAAVGDEQGRRKARGKGSEGNSEADGDGAGGGAGRERSQGLDVPAPAATQGDTPSPSLPPWESPHRTQGTAGLGRWALRN